MTKVRKCPDCKSEVKVNGSINHIAGMGYVSNSHILCEKCGYFEAFGPRW